MGRLLKGRRLLEGGAYLRRLFETLIRGKTVFFDTIETDIANYADDTTPYALDLKLDNCKVARIKCRWAFDWFLTESEPL